MGFAFFLSLFLKSLILSSLTVNCENFPNQPKIHAESAEKGLILEAAYDRNITLRLSHDSDLYFGDVNVLEEIRPLLAARGGKPNERSDNNNDKKISENNGDSELGRFYQLRNMRHDLLRLSRRLTIIQNRTVGPAQVRRYRRLLGRMRRLDTSLANLEVNLRQNECLKEQINPCKNGGTCFDGYKSFHCECPEGWTGKTCEEDVDECYILTGTDLGCQNNGVCVNTDGGYRCVCTGGFTGTHCRVKNATCESAQASEICGHGACVHTNANPNGYECICDQGWTKNNATPACIIDVDECSSATNPCHNGCINLPGTFKCEPCPPGYTGDGIRCRDIDECTVNNGGCSLQPKVRCINTEGSFHCASCPIGWLGDGRKCELAPSSSCNANNICHPRANCEYISGTAVCSCPPGLHGHGFGPDGCTPDGNATDPCIGHICQNNGTCALTGRGTFCVCQPGYFGPTCAQPDACQAHPCQNGGTCKLLPGNLFSCSCERGTTGKRCEIVREICGTVLRQESGSITYPSNGMHYDAMERCAWIIRTADTKVIRLTFTKFDLEEPEPGIGECNRDWLQIHDGRTLTAQMIGRFCGKSLPLGGTIVSSHQMLFFWFRSDSKAHGEGFTMTWSSDTHICGGKIELGEDETGLIRSPGYPGKTPPNRECEWQLNAPFGYRLILRAYEIQLGGNANCTGDTLKVYDSDLLLKAICTTDQPAPLHTAANKALIHLHTDGYLSDSAFQMHYEVVPGNPHCGGLFTEPTGIIDGYMEAEICEYLIQQTPGFKIELEIINQNFVQLDDIECELPRIEVFDGRTDEDELLKKLCVNEQLKEPLVSSSNFMLIRYEMPLVPLLLNKEFRAKYKRVCEERFYGPDGGIVTTPNYPKPYIDNIICTYDIYGLTDTVVHVNFTDFMITQFVPSPMSIDVTNSTFDYANYVEVYISKTNKRVFYRGLTPLSLVSQNNHLRIVFHGGANTQRARGFRIEYDFQKIGCGGVLAGNESSFYLSSLMDLPDMCEWIIEAPDGKHIFLNLIYDVGNAHKQSGGPKNLFIYSNTTDGQSKLLKNIGGSVQRFKEQIHSNIATIIWRKPVNEPNIIGFTLEGNFELSDSTCGGRFTSQFGVVQSSNWPNPYDPSEDCVWIIGAPLSHQIELVVHNFTLEKTWLSGASACRDDYLEVRNGGSENSPLIGKYCGTEIPQRIPSFGNHLYLHFHSDSIMEEEGFYLTWQQTRTGCGGKLTSHTGSIHSPIGIDENGAFAASCDWHIIVAAGSTVEITVSMNNLCENENILTIYDGPSTESRKLKWDCDKDSTMELIRYVFVNATKWHLQSTQNKVLVRFTSRNPDDNFILDYTTNCNTIMSNTLVGVIETPNFPDPYPNAMACSWDIHAKRNNKISLTFSHLGLEQRFTSCSYDYVEIIDMLDDQLLTTKHLCTQPNEAIISEGNRFLLKFVSDYSESERGFRVEYKRLGCGEHLQKPFGLFATPNAPYSIDLDCEWYIEAPAGKQIFMTFKEIHIESDEANCTENAIVISEEKNSNFTLFRECQIARGDLKITAPANRLYVHFHTNAQRTRKFFKASYLFVDATCGGWYYAPSGHLASPNYPDMSFNMECAWEIRVPDSFGISLELTTIDCRDGSILVRNDGTTTSSNTSEVWDLCEQNSQKNLIIYSDRIKVSMILRNNGRAVFALTYKKHCGGRLAQSIGFIRADPTDICEWELEAPEGTQMMLDILHLECPCLNTESCGFGVTYDRRNDMSNLTCSNNVTNFIDDRLFLRVKHISFHAKFATLEKYCGGRVTSLQGILAAPTQSGTYPAKMECYWEIVATKGNTLELNFLQLDIAASSNCNEDYLEIRTSEIGGKILGLYCGNQIPIETLVAFEKVWIKFKSIENSVGGKGFKLSWNYRHQNEYNSSSGAIESPPVYSARVEEVPYSWRIFTDRENRIELNLKSYSNGLQIFDGFDESALPVDIQYPPWRFTSSSNLLYLLTNNPSLEHFLVAWESVSEKATEANATVKECNEVIVLSPNSYNNLSSPGYPNGYKENLQCEWLIKPADAATHVVMRLYEARLEQFYDCSADKLRVSTSSDLTHWQEELKVCMTAPMNVRQPKNTIHGEPFLKVQLDTDGSISGSGFTSILSTSCGSNMTGAVGTILDKYLLRVGNWNGSCIWHITVNPGKRIRFTFDYNSAPPYKRNDQCSRYAVIYDGIDEMAPVLPPGRICNHPDMMVKVIETTSHRATLMYKVQWTPLVEPLRLWNLTYREYSDCDGEVVLTHFANSVNISSPRYPNVPHPHTECNWIVVAPPGEIIRADFIDRVDMSARYCNKEFVEFHDGSTATASRSLGHFCQRASTIRSTGNVLHIHYLTDIQEPRSGFKLNVSIARCGGTYYAMSGEISSNNYPGLGAYPKGAICEYTIRVQQSLRLDLNFTDIHIPFDEKNLDASDRIEVLTTMDTSPEIVAVFYGNHSTHNILQLNANPVTIRFVTHAVDNSKYRGFKLRYNHVFGPCRRVFSTSTGRISFNKLRSNTMADFCQWKINVPKGQRVRFNLQNIRMRNVTDGARTTIFSHSFVRFPGISFYNDYEMQSLIVNFNPEAFNGSSMVIRSTDNIMSVTIPMLYDNFEIESIEATYDSDEISQCPRDISRESLSGRINLGELLNGNFYCHVALSMGNHETMTFSFKELQLRIQNTVSNPNQYAVRFRDDNSFLTLGVLKRNVTNHFISMAVPRGRVSFMQNQAIQIKRFDVKYYRQPCGGYVTLQDDLQIENPNITEALRGELECMWIIRPSPTMKGSSYRLVGNASFSDSCEREYIAVYSGFGVMFDELMRICRDTPYFNGTKLNVGFKTIVYHSAEYRKPGQSNFLFKVEKTLECGGVTRLIHTSYPIYIDSKSYVNNYECSWEFTTNPGMMLSLHFDGRFFIEDSVNCTKDYLEVLEFVDGLWLPITRFCGRQVPKIFNTYSNRIIANFRTDESVTAEGFNFIVVSHCNAVLNVTEKTQLLRTPDVIFQKIKCEYKFVANSEKAINIRVKSATDSNNNRGGGGEYFPNRYCELAKFMVSAKSTNDSGTEIDESSDTFCNDKELRAYNSITLTYFATMNRGFTLEYDLNTCGGNITQPQAIHSVQEHDSDEYILDMNCIWYVTAPRDHSIVIRMKYFDMEDNTNCRFDYLTVYNGPTINDEKKLTTICGNLTNNPPLITTDNNQAVIVAVSDDSRNYRGFLGSIVFIQNCNERITLTDGNSPVTISRQFKVNASEELVCLYSITAPQGYRVEIQLRELQLNTVPCESSSTATSNATATAAGNCSNCNYIELIDSVGAQQESMGKFCADGRVDIKRISSLEDATMKIDVRLPGEYAIEIILKMEPKNCGPHEHFKISGNEAVSIVYPHDGRANYPANAHCTWRIDLDAVVVIEFNSFLLQNASLVTGECVDYLKVKENYRTKLFCGNATGFSYGGMNRQLSHIELTFHSDDNIESKGFNITIRNRLACNKTYTQLSGQLVYTDYINEGSGCVDEIRVPHDYILTLTRILMSFNMLKCSPEVMTMKIIDINTNKTLLEECQSCRSTPTTIFTTTNAVRVSVSSCMEAKLFYVASSRSLPPGCGGKIYATDGEITNPPYNDRNTSDCRWEITVPSPNIVQLSFYEFDMGAAINCHLDYVKIIDIQPNGVEKLIKILCGPELDVYHIESSSNRVAIVAKKSPNFSGTGWTTSFEALRNNEV